MSDPSFAEWFNSLNSNIAVVVVGVAAALIGAGSNIICGIVRDRSSRRQDKRKAFQVYRSYANPIALAASSLFWRLHELVVDERNDFLIASRRIGEFDDYKYNSTLYRLAALIAWLRAYRRELVHFSLDDPKNLHILRDAINELESVLADGTSVERQRLNLICEVWSAELPSTQKQREACGRHLDTQHRIELSRLSSNSAQQLLIDGTIEDQNSLCHAVLSVISQYVPDLHLPDDPSRENVRKTIVARSL